MKKMPVKLFLLSLTLWLTPGASVLATPELSPDRDRGEGPYSRLILRGVNLINGEGAPPLGPVDIVIEDNRIHSIHNVGYPGVPIKPDKRPEAQAGDRVLGAAGHTG